MTAVLNAFLSFLEKIGLIFDPSLPPDFSNFGEKFYISFEGLGIGQFQMNPVALNIGNGIRWYGILITIGIILAFLYVAKWRAKDCGYHFDDILDFVLIVVPVGVLGARLFYVFTSDGYNLSNWYRIWDGGLAIYGGVIAGAIALYAVGKYKKVRILRLMDCTVPGVMLAQAIGRWGNFCNGEAFGAETSSLLRMGLSFQKGGAQVYVHPTFLYESIWNILGFILINLFYKKKKFDGQLLLEYLCWYGFGRFFIELLRQDSLPLKIGSYNLRISSVIGLLCFVVCLILLIVFLSKKRNPALDEPCYYPGAKRLALMAAEQQKAEERQEKEFQTPKQQISDQQAQEEKNAGENVPQNGEDEKDSQKESHPKDEHPENGESGHEESKGVTDAKKESPSEKNRAKVLLKDEPNSQKENEKSEVDSESPSENSTEETSDTNNSLTEDNSPDENKIPDRKDRP